MKYLELKLLVLATLALTVGCQTMNQSVVAGVHVQLNDGQVLVGELTTAQFTLKTELGVLKFNAEDAGELGPLEGEDMEQSANLIRLWLRNGSEFVGSWEKPSVQVALDVGGKKVPVDVPIAKLKRLRFKGREVWAEKPLYRVRTRAGDDFFVNAGESRIHFDGELGEFSPFLTELALMEREDVEKNLWKIQLKNGSQLHVAIRESGLELRPAMGPDKVKLSWKLMAGLEPASMRIPAVARDGKLQMSAQRAEKAPGAPAYYSNETQRAYKKRTGRVRTQ